MHQKLRFFNKNIILKGFSYKNNSSFTLEYPPKRIVF